MKEYKAKNGITYIYDTLEELCYIIKCIQCPYEKSCHDNCTTCVDYEDKLEELEREEQKNERN